ncbi:MAG: hypothetical protein EAZ13_09890 [Sphingobacteriia bacterium]|nr:MAG: hypothetical protein EAZ13_09890 [Sphingobacteriia bacterium]
MGTQRIVSEVSQIYDCRNIFFEAIEAALINQLYLDALLFNNTENLVLSKSTKKIINQNFSSLTTTCIEFLILNAAELSFAEIAAIMQKSKDSIKYYYNTASFEFCVKGREQLMKYCLKNGLIKLPVYYDKTAQ